MILLTGLNLDLLGRLGRLAPGIAVAVLEDPVVLRRRRIDPSASCVPVYRQLTGDGLTPVSARNTRDRCRSLMRLKVLTAFSSGRTGKAPACPVACSTLIFAGLPSSQQIHICSRK